MSYSRTLVKDAILDHVITIHQHDALRSLGLVSLPFSSFVDKIHELLSPEERDAPEVIAFMATKCLFATVCHFADAKYSAPRVK